MRNPAVLAVCDRTAWGFGLSGAAAFIVGGLANSGFAFMFLGVAAGAVIGVLAIRRHFK